MNISPDLYIYLTEFADDKTILNMLSVNKKFNDDNFFKRVLQRRYPYLIEFKRDDETYKNLYLRMIYAIAKLQEDYDIPYVPNPKYDPDRLLKKILSYKKYYGTYSSIYSDVAIYAVEIGRLDIVKQMIAKGVRLISMLGYAARYGHMNVIEYIFSFGPVETGTINYAAQQAGSSGYLDIVKYLVSKGVTNFRYLLADAAANNHIDIVKYVIDRGVTDSDIYLALDRTDNSEIIKLLNEALQDN